MSTSFSATKQDEDILQAQSTMSDDVTPQHKKIYMEIKAYVIWSINNNVLLNSIVYLA